MKHTTTIIAAYLMLLVLPMHGNGQILKKLKEKAEQVANKALDKAIDKKIDETIGTKGVPSSGSPGSQGNSGRQGNTTDGGLVSTPPDVNLNLTEAEAAFRKNQYGDARYGLQQAMLGVELMIGRELVRSLPTTVAGLPADTTRDKVTSSGWGWSGLTIERRYRQSDKEFEVLVANNAVWMQSINLYLASTGYAQQTNEKQQWKQIRFKGTRSVIEFDKSSGYTLSVPIGQTTLVVMKGENFATEADFMAAANNIDIEVIKQKLGEK